MASKEKQEAQDFNAIANALNSGDEEALDRLMAAEEVETEEEEVEEEKEEVAPLEEEVVPEQPSDDKEGDEPPVESTAQAVETPKEDLEELKRELHRYKSDAGRVPFMQRRLVEVERELRAVKARTAVEGGTSSATDLSKVELDAETAAQIEELRSIDPIMAKTLERVAKAAVATAASKVDNAVSTYQQADQEAEDNRFYTEQKAALIEAVPQADAIFATPEWAAWKESLSPGRKAMAESAYADEVTQAIYAFAADMQRQQGRAEAPAVAAVAPVQEASEVEKARLRKVNSSAEVKTPSAKAGTIFDEEKLFAEMYNQIGKESHIKT